MRAQRAGTNRLIEARLRAYHDALRCGFTPQEARREAEALTRRETARGWRTLYEIRYWPAPDSYSKLVGRKLKHYRRACQIVRYLRRRGVDAFKAPIRVRL